MSDVSIPGVKSKYGTEKLIEDLMKVERIPRDRSAAHLEELKSQRGVWQDLGVLMTKVRDSAKALSSFTNPFSDRIAKSGDEAVLTATAKRDTPIETRMVLVKQKAEADRFLTKDLPSDYAVPAGTYSFKVGDKDLSFDFAGGTLKEFADAVTRRGKDLVKATVVTVTPGTSALALESLKTGAASRLGLGGAALDFALATGMLEKAASGARAVPISDSTIRAWDKPFGSAVKASGGSLTLAPGGEAELPLSPPVAAGSALRLSFEIRITRTGEAPADSGPPTGPAIPGTGSVTYKGVELAGDPSAVELPPLEAAAPPPVVEDLAVAFLGLPSGASVAIEGMKDSGSGFVKIDVAVPAEGLESLRFRNRNSYREVEVRGATVYDPAATGDYKPLRPISTAKDAIVSVDGIEMRRATNSIDDIIPGVTLSVSGASDKPVKLSVEPDTARIKDAVIAFVGSYNRLVAEINILSTRAERVESVSATGEKTSKPSTDAIVSELEYLSDAEKDKEIMRLGTLSGDFTLMSLKSALQRIMMDPYATRDPTALSLLAQIGISTNASKESSASKLRGYLEIDEAKLDAAIKDPKRLDLVRQLFGFDANGDLIVDTGAAYAMDSLLKAYVDRAGILATKTATLDGEITAEGKKLDTYDKALLAKEAELKRKYGMMEGALGSMAATSSSIDSFSKSGSGK